MGLPGDTEGRRVTPTRFHLVWRVFPRAGFGGSAVSPSEMVAAGSGFGSVEAGLACFAATALAGPRSSLRASPGGADLPQFAARAVGGAFDAGVVRQVLEQLDELGASVLGDRPLEDAAERGDVGVGIGDAQPDQGAADRGVHGDRVPPERLLDHGGRHVIRAEAPRTRGAP